MAPKLSHPRDPMLTLIRDGDRQLDDIRRSYTPMAAAIVNDHRNHGTSDQSVYRLDGGGAWTRLGTYEDNRHLLTLGPEYLDVTARTDPQSLAVLLAPPDKTPPSAYYRARRLIGAADGTAPLAGIVLALFIVRSGLEWDTDETVMTAARRLSRDAAYRVATRQSDGCALREVFADLVAELGAVRQPAPVYGQAYLATRTETDDGLAERGIDWGDPGLTVEETATRVGVTPATWRAYVSRHQAPGPDLPGSRPRWRAATIDAHRLQRDSYWWDVEPSATGA